MKNFSFFVVFVQVEIGFGRRTGRCLSHRRGPCTACSKAASKDADHGTTTGLFSTLLVQQNSCHEPLT